MTGYESFINQIPNAIMNRVERHLFSNIALFKPRTYIAGKMFHSEDFHVILPSAPPPDTYINGKLHSFTNRRVVVFNPGDTILSTGEGAKKEYISLLIKKDAIQRIARDMGFSSDIRFLRLENPYSGEFMQAIGAFCREVEREERFPLMLDCMAIQIMTLLLREFSTNLNSIPEEASNSDNAIARSLDYIRTYFNSNISIQDICNEINMSPYHFIRSFKQKYGLTPYQYLIELRINKAKDILACGQHSVSETAILCGFVSVSHFSSTFKRKTGVSPLEYKKA